MVNNIHPPVCSIAEHVRRDVLDVHPHYRITNGHNFNFGCHLGNNYRAMVARRFFIGVIFSR